VCRGIEINWPCMSDMCVSGPLELSTRTEAPGRELLAEAVRQVGDHRPPVIALYDVSLGTYYLDSVRPLPEHPVTVPASPGGRWTLRRASAYDKEGQVLYARGTSRMSIRQTF
jgi:hypothetical protein